MQAISESQINEQYRLLSSHQRARIMLIHKSCFNAAQSVFSNTPHTPEVIASVDILKDVMDAAIAAIANESKG